jgi:perosamine synthetase
MKIQYPLYRPYLVGKEKEYVTQCLDSTWISSRGEYVRLFEEKFSEYTGIKYSTTICNGTAALHIALLAAGIQRGDEVIVPSFTYIASVNSIAYCGARPLFVDSDPVTWQMDTNLIEKKITQHTKAIMVVHLYGHPCNMDKILNISHKHNLVVIEDCAEAFGTKYNDKIVGSFGDVAAFSFFGNKTITTGEGGMLATNNQTLIDKSILLKGQGVSPEREYWHTVVGYNYRMTNIAAAIGVAQLENADKIIYKKRQIAHWYKKYLIDMPLIFHDEKEKAFHTYWMVSILVNKSEIRDPLRNWLLENGIETRPTFPPVSSMPIYDNKGDFFPIAKDLSMRGLNLPSYPDLTESDIHSICQIIRNFYKSRLPL